jgi:hypothetical protein
MLLRNLLAGAETRAITGNRDFPAAVAIIIIAANETKKQLQHAD